MKFAQGYEDGFSGKTAQQSDAEYMRGFNLGVKQGIRVKSGTNTQFSATIGSTK